MEEDIDPIVYSRQEVIVEKIMFPEGLDLGDPRALCVKSNGEILCLDLRSRASMNLLCLSKNLELKKVETNMKNRIMNPIGIWADEDDTLTIANTYANHIRIIRLGNDEEKELLGADTLNGPRGIFKDKQGNLFICDGYNNRIMKYSHDGQVSQVNKGTQPTPFNLPTGLCVLDSGEVIVADCENNCIQKIDLQGNTSVFAGAPNVQGGYSDREPVQMHWPYNVKPLGSHLVFVDAKNSAVRVILKNGRVVSLRTNFDTTVRYLRGLAIDRNQNIYVSAISNTLFRIRPKPDTELALLIFQLHINDNYFATLPRELILIIADLAALNWHLMD